MLKKADLKCNSCQWELLVDDIEKVVFCQNRECTVGEKYKRVMPK